MALDEDGFLLTAFRKVKKIRKGLRSNGTSNMAGFLQRNRFMRLGEDWKNRACASVSLLTFYSSKPLLIGYLSRYSDILSGSLRSGILCEIDSELYMYVFSYQDSFVNMIDLNVHKIRKISITTFAHQHIQACYWTTDLLLPCFPITHVAFHVFHHYIGQYSFYLPFNMKKQVTFPD